MADSAQACLILSGRKAFKSQAIQGVRACALCWRPSLSETCADGLMRRPHNKVLSATLSPKKILVAPIAPLTCPTKGTNMSRGANEAMAKVTTGMKAPSSCSKAECRQELLAFDIHFGEDLTLQELRALVRRNRVQHGIMKDRTVSNSDMMTAIMRATKKELVAFAEEHDIGYPEVMNHGELRLHLRVWIIRNGQDDTEVTFGRHQGQTYTAVWDIDRQYVQWAVKESSSKTEADWRLVQMAAWAILTERVPSPFDEKMGKSDREKSLPPTCLASIMMIDPDVYVKVARSPEQMRLQLRSRRTPTSPAESATREMLEEAKKELKSENDTLKGEVAALRQEIRSLMSEKMALSEPYRKNAKEN